MRIEVEVGADPLNLNAERAAEVAERPAVFTCPAAWVADGSGHVQSVKAFLGDPFGPLGHGFESTELETELRGVCCARGDATGPSFWRQIFDQRRHGGDPGFAIGIGPVLP